MSGNTPKQTLRERLAADVDKASWEMLKPHYEREALFLIRDLELAAAAVAVAQDEAAKVKIWMDNGQLVKVDEELAQEWAKSPKEESFQFIIVQPYVFIQLLT